MFTRGNAEDTFVESISIIDEGFHVGERGELTCTVTINTEIGPDTSSLFVIWATIHPHHRFLTNDTTHQIIPLKRQSNTVFNSTLIITNITETSGGRQYICTADVEYSNKPRAANHYICVKGKT